MNKCPIPLNLPKDKTLTFEDVSFVNDMSEYSLKVFIKRLWQNLMELANVFDTRRNDVPKILDNIMSGKKWTKNDVYDRYHYGLHHNFIIQYDTLNREFTLLDLNTREPISDSIQAVTVTEAKLNAKKRKQEQVA